MTITNEHALKARETLARLGRINPDTALYQNLALSGVISAALSVTDVLEAILARIEAGAPPAIPGLPKGWEIDVQQTGNGNRHHRYVLTGPQFAYSSRYLWKRPEDALTAGIRHAQEQAAYRWEEPGLAAMSEPDPDHANGDQP